MLRIHVKTLPSLCLSLCLLSICLSPRTFAEPEVRHQFPPPEINREWIADELDPAQLIYLQGEQKFFAMFAEQHWGKTKGAVLIIPDPDEIPWPQHLLELHRELANYGWHSLIISMPAHTEAPATSPEQTPPANADSASPDEASESMETPDPYTVAVLQRLNAAIDYLHTKGQFNIAIAASGRSGVYAEQLLQQQLVSSHDSGVNPLQAVILINAQQAQTNKWIKALGGLPLPILDIYYNNPDAQRSAAVRRNKIKRQRKPVYNQVALPLPLPTGNPLSHRLARRCRGWLDQHITGKESNSLVKLR